METKELKIGNFVRLTDPISKGQIVRIESISENGMASWLGGAQYCDMELVEIEKTEISDYPISGEEYHYKISLTDKVEQIERDFGVKLYPESAVEFWKNRAEKEEKEHAKLAEWLSELNGYKDKTNIEPDFLIRNGFEKRQYDYLYCDDVEEITAQCIDAEMGVWRIYVGFLESGNGDTLDICTVGQLRMFLVIEGLDELAKQFK